MRLVQVQARAAAQLDRQAAIRAVPRFRRLPDHRLHPHRQPGRNLQALLVGQQTVPAAAEAAHRRRFLHLHHRRHLRVRPIPAAARGRIRAVRQARIQVLGLLQARPQRHRHRRQANNLLLQPHPHPGVQAVPAAAAESVQVVQSRFRNRLHPQPNNGAICIPLIQNERQKKENRQQLKHIGYCLNWMIWISVVKSRFIFKKAKE